MAKKTKKSRKKNRRTAIIFWTCLVLILTPFLVLGWILLSAWLDTGSPILGERYDGDLNPAITRSDLDSIASSVRSMPEVESVDVELATATLRVYADVDDNMTAEAERVTADAIYQAVASVLDPSVYFTQTESKKMYDLEIHVYNLSKNRDSEEFAYVIETRTSSMTEPVVNIVSEPIDAALAQQLRDNVENRGKPTPTPDETGEITVGGGEEAPAEETPAAEGTN